MEKKFSPISEKIPEMLHGADYNPEQWLDYPGVFEEDLELMKKAHCNVMSVGIFSWVSLEPEEGVFTFDWLDHVINKLFDNGIYVFLATPSGARPAWLSEKYPEVLRTGRNRVRNLHGERHNHCFTSPVYRKKTEIINSRLADRYAHHPGVIGWHISNEYGGDCHCDYCQNAFREWLKQKYNTLKELNHAWWAAFWSHTYTSWSQISSPAPHGEYSVHGLNLDWKRFVTDQTIDFYNHEVAAVRDKNPDLPATTNFMDAFEGLNYFEFAKHVDIVSWDSYPTWHDGRNVNELASWVAMNHDLMRSFKNGKPFMLLESTPSLTNWQKVSKLKKPGMHLLSSLQAVAHGSDTVQYFQWRKSRGSSEKFHGAVVDHKGGGDTRVFDDVKELGERLSHLRDIPGTTVKPDVAVVFDWENRWAVKDAQGPRNMGVHYEGTVRRHYQSFWEMGVSVDMIDTTCDFSKYKMIVAPMLYMMKTGVSEKIEAFVKNGGTFVTTYWSGIVDEHDLVHLGGLPEPVRKALGVYPEETDGLYEHETNRMAVQPGNSIGLEGEFTGSELCDIVRAEGAEVLGEFLDDFYAGRPALTRHQYGEGLGYYIASKPDDSFYTAFYEKLIQEAGIKKNVETDLPDGVTAQRRSDGRHDYIFIMNFSDDPQSVRLPDDTFQELNGNGKPVKTLQLEAYGVFVLKKALTTEVKEKTV